MSTQAERALRARRQRNYRQRRKQGRQTVSGAVAAELLRGYQEQGIGLRALQQATGLDRRTLQRVASGHYSRVNLSTYERLRDATVEPADGAFVSVVPTRRRFEALQLDGWTVGALTEEYGTYVGNLLYSERRGGKLTITWGAHKRFARMYDRLAGTTAPSKRAAHVSARARRLGYVPAFAWDDIDDPAERPKGVRVA